LSEYVRIRKDEWDDFLRENELLIQRHEALAQKAKELAQENSALREKIRMAEERLRTLEQKTDADIKETSLILQRRQAEMSRVLQQTEKALEM